MGNRRGYALAAALMVLALLSVLGAAAIQSSTLEVQISAHDRDARLALYLAEAALGEARYYASRGWGKVSIRSANQVTVDTPLPPGLLWDADRYVDFTLVDRIGVQFRILFNTDAVNPPVLTLAVGADPPTPGRFSIFRAIPSGTWSAPDLVVDDDAWATRSPPDFWQGWTLWNSVGQSFAVSASSTGPSPSGPGQAVRLRLSQDPGAGPYGLSLNPWLRALASGGTAPAGDADGGSPGWDRIFLDANNREIGRGRVTAVQEEPGRYLVTGAGLIGNRQRQATMRVRRAGQADQRVGDWTVQ